MFPNQKKAGFVPSKGKKKAGPPPAGGKAAPAMPPSTPVDDDDADDQGDAGPIEAATKSYDTATQTFRSKGKKKAKK